MPDILKMPAETVWALLPAGRVLARQYHQLAILQLRCSSPAF